MAVVSQPNDRDGKVSAPGKLDPSLGEFWVERPWEIFKKGHNLSSYERKRFYLNVPGGVRGRDFFDLSFLSGADNDGDGRSVVAGDFRNTGQLDLVVRQAGGGPLLVYENQLPPRHYLKVTLRGTKSNRLGVGARLTATARGRSQVREQYPLNSYRSQMPSLVHFGLGDADRVERLVIRWPSGLEQELTDLPADRHVVVTEGKAGAEAVEAVVPGRTVRP